MEIQQTDFISLMKKIDQYIQMINSMQMNNSTTNYANQTNTKEFERKDLEFLQPFKGDFTRFSSFWEDFIDIVDSTNISDRRKFAILRLKLDKRSLEIIDGLDGDDYELAKKKLLKFYQSKAIIQREALAHFKKFKPITNPNDLDNFIKLSNLSSNTYRSLKRINADASFLETFFKEINSKIPESIVNKFIENYERGSTVESMIEFLSNYVDTLQYKASIMYSLPDSSSITAHDFCSKEKSENFNETKIQTPKRNKPCPFCNDTDLRHLRFRCEKLPIQERFKIVKKNNLCEVCLLPNHTTQQCRSSYKCEKCGSRHSFILCKKNQKNRSPEETSVKEIYQPDNELANTLIEQPIENETQNEHIQHLSNLTCLNIELESFEAQNYLKKRDLPIVDKRPKIKKIFNNLNESSNISVTPKQFIKNEEQIESKEIKTTTETKQEIIPIETILKETNTENLKTLLNENFDTFENKPNDTIVNEKLPNEKEQTKLNIEVETIQTIPELTKENLHVDDFNEQTIENKTDFMILDFENKMISVTEILNETQTNDETKVTINDSNLNENLSNLPLNNPKISIDEELKEFDFITEIIYLIKENMKDFNYFPKQKKLLSFNRMKPKIFSAPLFMPMILIYSCFFPLPMVQANTGIVASRTDLPTIDTEPIILNLIPSRQAFQNTKDRLKFCIRPPDI